MIARVRHVSRSSTSVDRADRGQQTVAAAMVPPSRHGRPSTASVSCLLPAVRAHHRPGQLEPLRGGRTTSSSTSTWMTTLLARSGCPASSESATSSGPPPQPAGRLARRRRRHRRLRIAFPRPEHEGRHASPARLRRPARARPTACTPRRPLGEEPGRHRDRPRPGDGGALRERQGRHAAPSRRASRREGSSGHVLQRTDDRQDRPRAPPVAAPPWAPTTSPLGHRHLLARAAPLATSTPTWRPRAPRRHGGARATSTPFAWMPNRPWPATGSGAWAPSPASASSTAAGTTATSSRSAPATSSP